MPELVIYNATDDSFFVYDQKDVNDVGYNVILKRLLSRLTKKEKVLKLSGDGDYGIWRRSDRIIMAPPITYRLLKSVSNQLFIENV